MEELHKLATILKLNFIFAVDVFPMVTFTQIFYVFVTYQIITSLVIYCVTIAIERLLCLLLTTSLPVEILFVDNIQESLWLMFFSAKNDCIVVGCIYRC